MRTATPPHIQNLFQENGTEIILETGETLCRQGDPSDAVYWVTNGGLAVYVKTKKDKAPMLLNYIAEGELLGELGAITGQPRSATLIANQRSVLLCIPTPEFRNLLSEDPKLAKVMVETTRGYLVSADIARIHLGHTYQQMQKRITALGEEKQQLQELLRLREEMESMLVHDLKNPLNIIKAGLSLLEPIVAKTEIRNKESLTLTLTLMGSAAERMQQLINMLLDIAKMEAGKLVLRIQEFDLSELVCELIKVQQVHTGDYVTLISKLPPNLIIRGDRNLLMRVLTNLVDNALKFTPPEGKIEISARLMNNKQAVFVEITDSGPGIPSVERERIFDKFTQIDDERHQAQRGTGLGLTFCKMAIEAHGGRIWVEPGPDDLGSSFRFQIPQ